jgi:hypothetical protein
MIGVPTSKQKSATKTEKQVCHPPLQSYWDDEIAKEI